MASSVSSERAFSSAGITISKRRNRLKGDIVEALQGLKCLIRKNLLFREFETVDSERTASRGGDNGSISEAPWDGDLEDSDDDDLLDGCGNDDDDEVYIPNVLPTLVVE